MRVSERQQVASRRAWFGMPHCVADIAKPLSMTEVCNKRVGRRILLYGTWKVSILCRGFTVVGRACGMLLMALQVCCYGSC